MARAPLFPHWGRSLPPLVALPSPAPSLRVSEPATSPPPLRARGGWVPRRSAAQRAQHWESRRAPWAAAGAPVGFPRWLCCRPCALREHRSPRPVPEGSDCPLARRTERGRRQRDVLRGGRSGGGAERGSGRRQRRRGRRGGAALGGQRLTAACGGSCCPPWAEAAADRRQAQLPGKPRAQPSRAHRAQRPGLRAMGRAGGGGPDWGPPPLLLFLGITLVLTAGAVPGRYPPGPRPQPAPCAPPHARVSRGLQVQVESPSPDKGAGHLLACSPGPIGNGEEERT